MKIFAFKAVVVIIKLTAGGVVFEEDNLGL